ncbi:hypothetical protein [Sporosarcina psychrophila]|uniref:hypothetical protein n=1 Tax=Sporosarcina psychrophila TaxID=1476 RepID=UPI00078EB150|nr:hypothetical protein [Sporosarcina psychrophila]AMQ04976.1 hypothetical protein AZE41_02815 [Sporosarcina psychrophila]
MSKSILLARVQGIFIFIIALAILFQQLFNSSSPMPAIILYGCITMVLLLFPTIKRSTLIISMIMLVLGHILFFYYHLDFDVWKSAVSINLGLISLFSFVPMLIMPISAGGYLYSIEMELKRLHSKPTSVFLLLSFLTFLLGSVVNLAIIRVLYPLFKKTSLSPERLGKAMYTGFISTNVWSPYFASVAIILHFMELPYTTLGPFILTLAIIHFVFGNIVVLFILKKDKNLELPEEMVLQFERMNDQRKNMIQLIIIMSGIFILLFILEKATGQKMTVLVSIMGLLGSMIWLLFLKEGMKLKEHLSTYIIFSLPKIANELSLFISAGFFGIVVMSTPVNLLINSFINTIAGKVSLIFLIGILILLPVSLAFIGVHQIVSVTLLATSISPETIGLSTLAYGVLLAAAWCHSSGASPFSPLNLTLGSVLNKSSFNVGIGSNYLFFIGTLLITISFVYFIR